MTAAGFEPARKPMLAFLLGGALFIACYALPNVGPMDRGKNSDIAIYERYGESILDGEAPYRDFFVLYPPGALPLFVLPALGSGSGEGDYAVRFKLLQWVLGVATIAAVVFALQRMRSSFGEILGAAAFIGLAPAALGESFVASYDLWPVFLTTAAIASFVFGRDVLGFACLALGAAAKIYPVLLVPLAFLYVRRRSGPKRAWIGLGVFAGTLFAVLLPFLVLSPGGLRYSLSIQMERGLQIESLGASMLLAAHQLGAYEATVDHYLDSQNLGGSLPDWLARLSVGVQVLLVAAVLIVFTRRRHDTRALLVGSATMIAAFVVAGRVLSPQYLIWLVPPLAFVLSRRTLLATALLGMSLVLTQLRYPSRHDALVLHLDPTASWLVVARNVVLVVLFVELFRLLLRRPHRLDDVQGPSLVSASTTRS